MHIYNELCLKVSYCFEVSFPVQVVLSLTGIYNSCAPQTAYLKVYILMHGRCFHDLLQYCDSYLLQYCDSYSVSIQALICTFIFDLS